MPEFYFDDFDIYLRPKGRGGNQWQIFPARVRYFRGILIDEHAGGVISPQFFIRMNCTAEVEWLPVDPATVLLYHMKHAAETRQFADPWECRDGVLFLNDGKELLDLWGVCPFKDDLLKLVWMGGKMRREFSECYRVKLIAGERRCNSLPLGVLARFVRGVKENPEYWTFEKVEFDDVEWVLGYTRTIDDRAQFFWYDSFYDGYRSMFKAVV